MFYYCFCCLDSGKVAVFDVAKYGRMGAQPSLPAHGAAVTDIEFSPFHHNLLLTASEDTTVLTFWLLHALLLARKKCNSLYI